MKRRIIDLFSIRDIAVKNNDPVLFLSTQNGQEIDGSKSSGYLSLDSMKSEILHIHQDEEQNGLYVVFVKESYFSAKIVTHTQYLLYKALINDGRVDIVDIVW